MTQIDNLSKGNLDDIFRRLRALEFATNQRNMAIGSGGLTVYGGGGITIENGGLYVTGTATISGSLDVTGTLTQSGTTRFTGQTFIYGPLEVTGDVNLDGTTDVTGAFNVTGPTKLNGVTDVGGAFTVTGVTKLNGATTVAGDTTVSGKLDVTGAMATKGPLSVEGVTTLKNDLNVSAGKKINLGSISLESGGSSGGQINLVGGALSSSAVFGTQLIASTLEVAGTSTLKISSPSISFSALPENSNKANLFVSASGRLYISTAA